MADRRYVDNTMLNDYKCCPRRYFLRHKKHWRRSGIAAPLVFGLSWHNAMDALWENFGKVDDGELLRLSAEAFDACWIEQGMPAPDDMGLDQIERLAPRTPFVAREMLAGYLEARRHILSGMRLVAVEQPFAVPLPYLPNTWYCGRLDKVFDYNSIRIIDEHKTTTEYKIDGGFKSNYLEGWYLDSQIMGYLYGGGLFFEGLEQVWVDAALVHKKVHDKFKFVPITHSFSMLENWVNDTCEWINRIDADEKKFAQSNSLPGGVYPKQTEACFGKFGSCQFVDICRTCPDPSQLDEVPTGFTHEEWSPFSILKLHKLLEAPNED